MPQGGDPGPGIMPAQGRQGRPCQKQVPQGSLVPDEDFLDPSEGGPVSSACRVNIGPGQFKGSLLGYLYHIMVELNGELGPKTHPLRGSRQGLNGRPGFSPCSVGALAGGYWNRGQPGPAVPGRLSLAGPEASPTELFLYKFAFKKCRGAPMCAPRLRADT